MATKRASGSLFTSKSRMDTWFTSDHHFGHKKIIEYCDRPYDSVEEMNEALVAAWNNCVKEADTVYYLGDFSLSRTIMEQYAPRLNGRKILIAGNHDKCHPSNNAGQWSNLDLYRKYFDAIYTEHEWNDWMLHHIPYHDEVDHRFEEYRPVSDGRVLLHGHVHQRWLTNGRQINVGVDVWDYTPVHEDQIRELVTKLEPEDWSI
jgi:calcineurin-like phosphoesterase family protein